MLCAAEIARRFDLRLRGRGEAEIIGVCTLSPGQPDRLAYVAGAGYREALAGTRAGAVILTEALAPTCPVPALIASDPQLAYARVASLFLAPLPPPGVAAGAYVEPDAEVDPSAAIGPGAVVSAQARIAAGAILAPGVIIGRGAQIGADCCIEANAVIGDGVYLGQRVLVGAASVLGGRGFGLVRSAAGWEAIPQLGAVMVGDDVEIGAACTIDRGAIEDTVLEAGVKLDDQVHIAHNCRIGAHTVIAGCTGIAGSSRIGRGCMIGGGVGIGDHVSIADEVVITGGSQVPADISVAGLYSSTLWPMPAGQWRRRIALLKKLDGTEKRLRALERGATKTGEPR